MANFTCHARIWLPTEGVGKAYLKGNEHGHYDLRIDNNGSNLSFDGHTFTDPVFSYSGYDYNNQNVGAVTLYSSAETNHYITGHGRLYHATFIADSDLVREFIDWLKGYLGTSFEINDTHGFIYRVTSGPFAYYDFDNSNCFAALAAWCNKLGYNVLQNIYDSSSSCEDYFAWRMFERYGHAWTLIDEK